MRRNTHVDVRSPLYTSKRDAADKKKFIQVNGCDFDGAYRVVGRQRPDERPDASKLTRADFDKMRRAS